MLDMVGNFFTVQLLELGHFGEDYPITTFFENKRFSSFLQMNLTLRAASIPANSHALGVSLTSAG